MLLMRTRKNRALVLTRIRGAHLQVRLHCHDKLGSALPRGGLPSAYQLPRRTRRVEEQTGEGGCIGDVHLRRVWRTWLTHGCRRSSETSSGSGSERVVLLEMGSLLRYLRVQRCETGCGFSETETKLKVQALDSPSLCEQPKQFQRECSGILTPFDID